MASPKNKKATEMKRLIFAEGLMGPTLMGGKYMTLRKYRPEAHDFAEGEIICGEFRDGLDVLLRITADTEKKPFSELTDEEAQERGFESGENAFNGLKADYYPDLQKSDVLATIRYEVLQINGVPVVRINEHAR